ncbi:hypothetical protein RZS08_51000, partial [Arthrospira platensis SPKY1]|nr:hypothetical protein [Arthrospira platensis SPKY1]
RQCANEPLAKNTFGVLLEDDVKRALKELESMKLISLKPVMGAYEITFSYFHKDTKQNVVRSFHKIDRMGNQTPHYLM